MVYQMQIPPFEIGNFENLSAEQAKKIFNWYVGEIPLRLEQLQRYLNEQVKGSIKLTMEVNTLAPLWDWFCKTIQIRPRTHKELEDELKSTPEWLHDFIKADDKKLTLETLSVGMDIAIYFAEVVVHNNPAIHWGYYTKPKRRVSVNEPVLLGFSHGMELNPRHILHTLMLRYIRNADQDGLLETYNIWSTFIPAK